MRVYLDESLYVDREDGGPLDVFHEGGGSEPAWTLPEDAVELLTPDESAAEVLDRVRTALAGVTMSKTARAGVERVLDDLAPAD